LEDKQIKLHGGVVATWFPDRGFGFVLADSGQSYFCHVKTLQQNNVYEPAIGDRLLFELVPSRRRPDSQEVGGHCERLNTDGSRRTEPARPPRPASLQEAAKQEAKAFAQLQFLSRAPR
jgi:cold shock CspA family protein